MRTRVAILIDGGFVRKRLERRLGRFPSVEDVVGLQRRVMRHPRLERATLLRTFFHDAPPLSGTRLHPLTGNPFDFGRQPTRTRNQRLQDGLAMSADFAVRRGETVFRGWRLRREAIDTMRGAPRALEPDDFVPDIEQKGVDLRIGLDVAWLSVRRIVGIIVLVTGDSDLVPAMKFARREGLKVYLDTLGHGVRPPLVEHADLVFDSSSLMSPEG